MNFAELKGQNIFRVTKQEDNQQETLSGMDGKEGLIILNTLQFWRSLLLKIAEASVVVSENLSVLS